MCACSRRLDSMPVSSLDDIAHPSPAAGDARSSPWAASLQGVVERGLIRLSQVIPVELLFDNLSRFRADSRGQHRIAENPNNSFGKTFWSLLNRQAAPPRPRQGRGGR